MADTHDRLVYRPTDTVSRNLMRGILVLLITVLALVAYARVTDRPLEAVPDRGEIVQERLLHIEGDITGAARIADAETGEVIEYASGEAVFITTIERVLRRERERHAADMAAPLHLRERAGGALSVYDPTTGEEVDLTSFGTDNIAAFAVLLPD
jgi:putative photosynthetic complex assembly protein